MGTLTGEVKSSVRPPAQSFGVSVWVRVCNTNEEKDTVFVSPP